MERPIRDENPRFQIRGQLRLVQSALSLGSQVSLRELSNNEAIVEKSKVDNISKPRKTLSTASQLSGTSQGSLLWRSASLFLGTSLFGDMAALSISSQSRSLPSFLSLNRQSYV
ncbi:hypothetical protein MRB53_034378 [Persea americana]|uniref:Uncharacterized protein n=1 Tax=Persea americana TaxID=3435 RepID=A0ACC2KXJ8_PERAE|nr:hypothetical protein MRB53_034378 [Persea americana]